MSWYEIEQPGTDYTTLIGISGFAADDKKHDRRVFHVAEANPQLFLTRQGPSTILNNVGQGLPIAGTAHPTVPTLFLSRWSTQNIDVLNFYAIAEYDEYIIERSGGFQNEVYELPIALRKIRKVPGVAGGPEQTIIGWEFSTQSIIEAHERLTVKVRLDAEDWGSILAQIRLQHNKLQKIRGAWFRFEMPDYVQVGRGMVEVTYSFFSDAGITTARVDPPPQGEPRKIFVPLRIQRDTELSGAVDWVRPPFNNLSLVPQETAPLPESEPLDPIVVSVRGLEISHAGIGPAPDGQGWQLLPGIPLDL